MNCFCGMAI